MAKHPDAADSVTGIRQFWLAGRFAVNDKDVVRALDGLAAAGEIKCFPLADGTYVYSAQRKIR